MARVWNISEVYSYKECFNVIVCFKLMKFLVVTTLTTYIPFLCLYHEVLSLYIFRWLWSRNTVSSTKK
jgi:hypothetical protein